MTYKMEVENEQISFLDLNIHRNTYGIEVEIYHKLSQTDVVILHSSTHPNSHKMAAFIHVRPSEQDSYYERSEY
jgi:hypothetical protein